MECFNSCAYLILVITVLAFIGLLIDFIDAKCAVATVEILNLCWGLLKGSLADRMRANLKTCWAT